MEGAWLGTTVQFRSVCRAVCLSRHPAQVPRIACRSPSRGRANTWGTLPLGPPPVRRMESAPPPPSAREEGRGGGCCRPGILGSSLPARPGGRLPDSWRPSSRRVTWRSHPPPFSPSRRAGGGKGGRVAARRPVRPSRGSACAGRGAAGPLLFSGRDARLSTLRSRGSPPLGERLSACRRRGSPHVGEPLSRAWRKALPSVEKGSPNCGERLSGATRARLADDASRGLREDRRSPSPLIPLPQGGRGRATLSCIYVGGVCTPSADRASPAKVRRPWGAGVWGRSCAFPRAWAERPGRTRRGGRSTPRSTEPGR